MVRRCTRRGSRVLSLAIAAAVALGLPRVVHSQILYGLVTGTVRDAQGGALSGVTVTAANSGTGLRLETVTDATGNYTFRNMPTGDYDLTASVARFRPITQLGLPVTAGKNIRVDLTLELGELTETVEVRAETSIMKTEKSDLGTEVTGKQVLALPLNRYRNYQSLYNLVPGVTPPLDQNDEIDTPGRSLKMWVNGVQPNSNTTRVDGAVSINIWLPHHAGYIQPAETIETVNISTNAFDADQGMAAGMAQTVVTKSGTNEFRGSGFWFLNRDELNANSYYNTYYGLEKPNLDTNIYGGTLGGPIVKNKLFFFGGYEMYRDRRGRQATYAVPTAKMRAGDFSEVAASYANFRLYDPLSSATPAGRTQFPGSLIPPDRISSIAKTIIQQFYPMPTSQDLNSNQLLDDWVRQEVVKVDRANYDLKLTFQRSPSHSIWGKFSMMDATVVDNYLLGWDNGSVGDTKVYVAGLGHTWTLGPTLVLDGNFGYNRQDQTVKGPDYGTNYGLDLGIPGVNDPDDIRASGMAGLYNGYPLAMLNWTPLFRKEITYSFSSALTKVFTGHEIRSGVDVVRLELNHRQAEIGTFGLRGGFGFNGYVTGAPGYAPLPANSFAEFLMGLAYYDAKDVQTEDMTGREWQTALYVRDRWLVNQKLTLNLGLRAEYYPLMTRAHSGIERLLYDSYEMILGGRGGQPRDVGVQLKEWYLVPRVGAAYRFTEHSVLRAGYGRTINPLPWSRPLRGGFPYDVAFSKAAEMFGWVTTLEQGIPPVPIPDYQSGQVKVPAGVVVNSPNPTNVDRATIQQWNVAFERRLPLGIVADVAYVGTATDGGYAFLNVNHGEPGGGQTSRHYYKSAGTTTVNDWRSCLKSRYRALQVSFSRLRQNGLMLKGAYTLSRARDMSGGILPDEDGWTGLAWNHPMMYDENYATAGFDRTHVLDVGFAYDLPFLRDSKNLGGVLLGGWQVAGVFSAHSGTPFSVPGTNTAMNCPDCGPVTIDVRGDPEPTGEVGVGKAWYDKALFSQPSGTTKAGFGNSLRNPFRRPPAWNLNMGFYKAFRAGRLRPELRIDVSNIFNTVNWGTPVTAFTANTFMQFTPDRAGDNATSVTGTPGARRVNIGVRVQF